MLLAHGIGTRTDLPVPIGLAALAAAAALIISFAVLGLLWRRPRPERPGRPLPRPLATVLESPTVRTTLKALTALLAAAVCAVGLFGPATVSANLAPWMFYIVFWVGIVPASVLLGPVWRVLNPLRILHTALARALRIDPSAGVRTLPASWGYRPAAVSLAAFGWFELVYPDRAAPGAVAVFLLTYAVVHVVAATVFGRGWFERADGFEVYSALLGTLAPVGRLPDGRLGWRNPLDGLQRFPIAPGLSAVVIVLIGTTAYDGLSRSTWWTSDVPGDAVTSTLGLLGAMLAVCVIYNSGPGPSWAPSTPTATDPARPPSRRRSPRSPPGTRSRTTSHCSSSTASRR